MTNRGSGSASGMLAEVSEHLAGIFRHMLPGVIVIGGVFLAYPRTRAVFNFDSWPHVLILAVITVTAGNIWFALNRYGPHQVADYILYVIKSKGPVPQQSRTNYITDLGRFVHRSLHGNELSARARQHVVFRASAMLLLWTFGEAALLFSYFHADDSILKGHERYLQIAGGFAILIGIWQMVITRRIDYFVVKGTEEN